MSDQRRQSASHNSCSLHFLSICPNQATAFPIIFSDIQPKFKILQTNDISQRMMTPEKDKRRIESTMTTYENDETNDIGAETSTKNTNISTTCELESNNKNATPKSMEDIVEQLWLEKPGMGMKEMMEQCQTRFAESIATLHIPPSELKKRIKNAKALVPFRRIGDLPEYTASNPPTKFEKESFVQKLLLQRTTFRQEKQYKKADRITRGLTAMGIHINDGWKTWAVGVPPTTLNNSEDTLSDYQNNPPKATTGVPCSMCGKLFPSRNRVFAHLKDPASGCGTFIFSAGQTLPEAPSHQKKVARQEELRINKRNHKSSSRVNFKTGGTATHAHAQCSLWVGDLPLPWTRHGGKYKRLRALLFAHVPRDVPMPWIKTVVRKGYRARTPKKTSDSGDGGDEESHKNNNTSPSQQQQSTTTTSTDTPPPKNHAEYLGYAIVVFRDADEATAVRTYLDGTRVSPQTVYRPQQLEILEDTTTTTTTTTENDENDNDSNTPPNNKDALELGALPSFVLKVRAVENGDSSALQLPEHWKDEYRTIESLPSKLDPPLMEQLRPLPAQELQRRTQKLLRETDNSELEETRKSLLTPETHDDKVEGVVDDGTVQTTTLGGKKPLRDVEEHQQALELAVSAYSKKFHHSADDEEKSSPLSLSKVIVKRQEIHLQGEVVPQVYLDRLLGLLETLRWPAQNERQGLSAERYLVLPTNIRGVDPHYGELREACQELMENHPLVPSSYYYSGIAVTKNFVASPHVDVLDQTYQFAISLGSFSSGGELCVECGQDGEAIRIVETKNRLAQVDGRHVHWVRTWEGGDRYSLIFYDTSDRNPTPVI